MHPGNILCFCKYKQTGSILKTIDFTKKSWTVTADIQHETCKILSFVTFFFHVRCQDDLLYPQQRGRNCHWTQTKTSTRTHTGWQTAPTSLLTSPVICQSTTRPTRSRWCRSPCILSYRVWLSVIERCIGVHGEDTEPQERLGEEKSPGNAAWLQDHDISAVSSCWLLPEPLSRWKIRIAQFLSIFLICENTGANYYIALFLGHIESKQWGKNVSPKKCNP